jgi:hypothetical protein
MMVVSNSDTCMQLNKKGGWVGWGGVWWLGMIPIEASIALSFSLNYCDSNFICGHERFEQERLPFCFPLFSYIRGNLS